MARTSNKIHLLGNIGANPELKQTDSGKKVVTFSLATSPPWNENETNWHRVVAWEKTAEIIAQYVKKGDQIYVVGRLRYNTWQDDAGNNRKTAEVVVDDMTLLGRRGDPVQETSAPDNVGQQDLPI